MPGETFTKLIFSPRCFFRKKTVLSLLVFAAAFVVRLNNLEHKNIWMDEDAQSERIRNGFFDPSLVNRASEQQQPPVDYYFEAIGLKNFGVNETGARIHSAFLGSLAAVAFFLLSVHVMLKPPAVILGVIVFVFHPYLLMYSQEGRPISCGVFFAALYLLALFCFFGSRKNRLFDARRFLLLVGAQTGFLLSVGFQPLVFLASSSIASVPLFFIKRLRLKIALSYLSTLCSLLFAIPLLLPTIDKSGTYLEERNVLDMPAKIMGEIGVLSLDDCLSIYKTMLGDWWPICAVACVLALAGFMLNRRNANRRFFAVYLLLFFLVFPPMFEIVFKSLISYEIKPRYYLTFATVTISLAAVLFDYSIDFVAWTGKRSPGVLSYAIFVAVLALFGYSLKNNLETVHINYFSESKADWKAMYDLFKLDDGAGSLAYMVNLIKIDAWNPGFYSQKYYYKKEDVRPVVLNKADQLPRDVRNLKFKKGNKNIYLVTTYGTRKIRHSFFENVRNVEQYSYTQLSVIKIKGGRTVLADTLGALRALKDNLEPSEDNYKVYELLFHMEMKEGNLDEAAKALNGLVKMDERGKLKRLVASLRKRLKT